eukprot:m.99966 g.99966  ORF g.99966 m.99966 type:complete len:168 (-) comp27208_c0_seq1:511-1014(-)
MQPRTFNITAAMLFVLVAMFVQSIAGKREPSKKHLPSSLRGDYYSVLKVKKNANAADVKKAYRKLAKIWHPDKTTKKGMALDAANSAFEVIGRAQDVLTNPEKREIFDRLGENGLRRLQDGDPTVKKGWLPPDEVLRRAYPPGPPQGGLDWFVTTLFSFLEGKKKYD